MFKVLFLLLANWAVLGLLSCNNNYKSCEYRVHGADSSYKSNCISCHSLDKRSLSQSKNIFALEKLSSDTINRMLKTDSLHILYTRSMDTCALKNILLYIKKFKETYERGQP